MIPVRLVAEPVAVPAMLTQVPKFAGPGLAELMPSLASSVRARGFPVLAFIRPEPLHSESGRLLHSVSSHAFEPHAELLTRVPGAPDSNAFTINLSEGDSEWARTFAQLGYQLVQVVRVPVLGTESYDFVMFSTSRFLREEQTHGAVFEVMSAWAQLRDAIRAEICPLSLREREALQAVAQGLKGAEANDRFGYTERTFRLHVDNAKRKMRATNSSQAVYRAQLLCGL